MAGDKILVLVGRDSRANAEAVQWTLQHLRRPGDSICLLHFVHRVPVGGSSTLKVSEAAAHIVQAHLEYIVQPELRQLKKLCTNSQERVLVDTRTILHDENARGILGEVRTMGCTRLVMTSSASPSASPRRLLGSIFHVHRWGLGKTADACVRGRPLQCSVHILHKGKLVYQEAALKPRSSPAWQGGSFSTITLFTCAPASNMTSSSASEAESTSAAGSPAIISINEPSVPHYSLSGGLTAHARMRRRSLCEAQAEAHFDDEKFAGPREDLWCTMLKSTDQRLSFGERPDRQQITDVGSWY
eukprot:SM000022S07192  [mRNA]  locus=s22:389160:390928:+ [translate_table: standard]